MQQSGIRPNVIIYNIILSAFGKCSKFIQALQAFDGMKNSGFQPDGITYNTTITACKNGGHWEQALVLLEEMKDQGLQPDVITCNTTITTCGNGGQLEQALVLLEEMKHQGLQPNGITFIAVIEACFLAGCYSNALCTINNAGRDNFVSACRKSNGLTSLSDAEKSAQCRNGVKEIKCNLRGLPLSVACKFLCQILINIVCHKAMRRKSQTRRILRPEATELIIITGKGLRSDRAKGPVLRTKIRQFLSDNGGPEIVDVGGNDGHSFIPKRAIRKWLASKDCVHFREKMMA
eukprot:scaffold2142_cov165-Amphora_coffeaeformis.AAC.4